MAWHEDVVLICDLCGKEDDTVETHLINVDGIAREGEACLKCWVKVTKLLDPFYRAGRDPEPPKKRARPKEAGTWPGSKWDFTFHALQRMGERRVPVEELLTAVETPQLTRPGNDEGVELREKNGIKVAVNLADRTVLTVSRKAAKS